MRWNCSEKLWGICAFGTSTTRQSCLEICRWRKGEWSRGTALSHWGLSMDVLRDVEMSKKIFKLGHFNAKSFKSVWIFLNILSINTLEWDKKWESAAFRVSHPFSGFPSFLRIVFKMFCTSAFYSHTLRVRLLSKDHPSLFGAILIPATASSLSILSCHW